MENNEALMETIKWVFSGIGLWFLTVFFQKNGVIKKLRTGKNTKVFQADRDINNNSSNNITHNITNNNYGSKIEPIENRFEELSKRVAIDQEKSVATKLSVKQAHNRSTEDISRIKKLIIDSEQNNSTLKNYLSENIVILLHSKLFNQSISQYPGITNVPKLRNARSPRVTSIDNIKDIMLQKPIYNVNKSIDLKFSLNVLVNLYTRVHTTEFDDNNYSDLDNYSYSPDGMGNQLFNGKYWLKITGIVSIGINNKIFEVMNLFSLENHAIKEILDEMYTSSIISIESIENRK